MVMMTYPVRFMLKILAVYQSWWSLSDCIDISVDLVAGVGEGWRL